MIITLKSTNEDFSWVIEKNPQSPPKLTRMRKGVGIGYYSSLDQYNLVFIEGSDELSYPEYENQEFAYLARSSYESAICASNLLWEFFSRVVTRAFEKDVPANHWVSFSNLRIKQKRTVNTFSEFFGVTFENNILEFQNKTLKESLQLTVLFTILIALDNYEYVPYSKDLAMKYVRILIDLDVPYFIRYVFKTMLFRDRGTFKKIQDLLNESNKYNLKITYGDNHIARLEFVKEHLALDTLLDVGCGEGFYIKKLGRRVGEYYAVDINEEILDLLKRKFHYLENLQVSQTIPQINGEFDILLTEVIEHIELEAVIPFIETLLELEGCRKIVLTTPNKEFNQFYELEGMRHEDHKWEMGYGEFENFIGQLKESVTLYSVGDSVNKIPTTIGAVIYND